LSLDSDGHFVSEDPRSFENCFGKTEFKNIDGRYVFAFYAKSMGTVTPYRMLFLWIAHHDVVNGNKMLP
jgi:hypothetical protein